jgi:hypothetical protein
MSSAIPRTIRLEILESDASLLLVALWQRTREAANRTDYVALREHVLRQLSCQGFESRSPDDIYDPRQHDDIGRLWKLLYESEDGSRHILGEILHDGPRCAATTTLMTLFWDDRLDGASCTPIVECVTPNEQHPADED